MYPEWVAKNAFDAMQVSFVVDKEEAEDIERDYAELAYHAYL